jgi:hypothetical protein
MRKVLMKKVLMRVEDFWLYLMKLLWREKRKSYELKWLVNGLMENLRWMLNVWMGMKVLDDRMRMLNLRSELWSELSKGMLVVDVNVLIGQMVDDLAGDVDERDVVGLGDVENGIAGTVGESSHADVQAVIAGLNVIDGELCKEVNSIGGRKQSKVNLLCSHFRILLPEKSDDLEPELHDGDKTQRGALMIFFYFSSNDVEGGLDEVWEVFGAEGSSVGLESLIVFEVMGFVIDHPGRFLVLLFRSWLTE